MEDKDLEDIGIKKKGARIDILRILKERKENSGSTPFPVNQVTTLPYASQTSETTSSGPGSPTFLAVHSSDSYGDIFSSSANDQSGSLSLSQYRTTQKVIGSGPPATPSFMNKGPGLAASSSNGGFRFSQNRPTQGVSGALPSATFATPSLMNMGPGSAASGSNGGLGVSQIRSTHGVPASTGFGSINDQSGDLSSPQNRTIPLVSCAGTSGTPPVLNQVLRLGGLLHTRTDLNSSLVNANAQSTSQSSSQSSSSIVQSPRPFSSRDHVFPGSSSTSSMVHAPVSSSSNPCMSSSTDFFDCNSEDRVNYNSEDRVKRLVETAASNLKCGFDLKSILQSSRNGSVIWATLEKDGHIDVKARKTMSNILVNHIIKSGLNANPVVMREEIAVLIALSFPKLRMRLKKRIDMPWHLWFNSSTNTGFLENSNVGFQRAEKRLTGVGIRKSNKVPGAPRKLVVLPKNRRDIEPDDPEPPEFIRDVTEARNLLGTEAEKLNIMNLMRKTYQRRRADLEFREVSDDYCLTRYPHFLSYAGEVIEQEFSMIHPNSSSLFLRSFSLDFVPRIMKIAREDLTKYAEEVDYFGDDVLNSLLVLSKLLPTPRRTYDHEELQPRSPYKVDLIHMIEVGTDPQVEITKRRNSIRYPLQPHLMIKGHPKAMGQMYIVCGNGECFELHRQASPTNAIDLLFKTYFALYLHYPLGWKNVLRFLQVHVYNIPVENRRESTFEDVVLTIRNTVL